MALNVFVCVRQRSLRFGGGLWVLSRTVAVGCGLIVGLGLVAVVVILLVRPFQGVETGQMVFVQKLALLVRTDGHV